VLRGVQVLRCVVTSEFLIFFGDVGRVEHCDVLCDLEKFFLSSGKGYELDVCM
jgi:hypothetical protein